MKEFETNLKLWNGWAKVHKDHPNYGIERFLKGENRLSEIELAELGDVSGKSLLHLQCHIGVDSLSFSRMGADVTGIDFSEEAVKAAKDFAEKTGLSAKFIQSNIYDIEEVLADQFDIVFTSYGVLAWLPDLEKWAKLIARYLKPGGVFFIAEFHPAHDMICEDGKNIENSYFNTGSAKRFQNCGSYVDSEADFRHDSLEWFHSLGEVVNSLIGAGLVIKSLKEYPFCPFEEEHLVEKEPGHWVFRDLTVDFPMIFSIKAEKPV